jgi:hypothetical protein
MFTGRIVFIALVILLVGTPVSAESRTSDGNEFLRHCTEFVKEYAESELFKAGSCYGFIEGYLETWSISQPTPTLLSHCFPETGVPNIQIARIIIKYLQDHPERLHYGRAVLLDIALNKAFPCNIQTAPR